MCSLNLSLVFCVLFCFVFYFCVSLSLSLFLYLFLFCLFYLKFCKCYFSSEKVASPFFIFVLFQDELTENIVFSRSSSVWVCVSLPANKYQTTTTTKIATLPSSKTVLHYHSHSRSLPLITVLLIQRSLLFPEKKKYSLFVLFCSFIFPSVRNPSHWIPFLFLSASLS